MKTFISHSWKNKTQAQMIADELKAFGADLWLDANNLLSGQEIQNTIDEVLSDMDVVVLVWSREAAESDGVAAEIRTSVALNKLIIPCKLDGTPLDPFPEVKKIKGINFADIKDGLGRLKMVLVNYQSRNFGLDSDEAIVAMNDFMGALETANYLVQKQDIKNTGSEADKDFWVDKIGKTHDESYEKLSELTRIGKETESFLKLKMADLQMNINNREQCLRILQEMEAFPYSDQAGMPVFIEQVRKICESFNTHQPNAAIEKFRAELQQKTDEAYDLMKKTTGWLVGDLFDSSFDQLRYFYCRAADHLEFLDNIGKDGTANPAITTASADLLRYIQTPGGIIDNNEYGIVGYTDDVYLIHSILLGFQQSGLVDLTALETDWDKLNAGAETAFTFIDANLRQRLEQEASAYFNGLFAAADQQTESENDRAYADLEKARDDLWRAKLTGLEGDMLYGTGPVY